jgi:predicted ester cyclase
MTTFLRISLVALMLSISVYHSEIFAQSHINSNSTFARKMSKRSREERNKKIAIKCIKAWNDNKINEIVKHLAPNTVDYGDGTTPPARGIDTARMFMDLWRSSVNQYKSENEIVVADGDYVFIYADWIGSFKSDFMGMKTARKSFNFKDVNIFKFDKQGKITEHRAILFSRVLNELAATSN